MKKSMIILLFLVSFFSLQAQDDTFSKAKSAYQAKNFTEALSLFEELGKRYTEQADILYNIGNCHFQLNELGKAILSYKRALKYDPSHKLAYDNLELALSLTKDKQPLEDDNFISQLIIKMMNILSLNRLALILILLFLVILFIIDLMIIRYRNRDKSIPIFLLVIFLILFALFSTISVVQWQRYHSQNGAVLLATTEIGYSGPSDEFTRVFTIHEGMIFEIEKVENEWSLIKLPNGIGGWIKTGSYGLI